MFVDASALVAVLTAEPSRVTLLDCLDAVEGKITSPLAIFETVVAVARKKRLSVAVSEQQVREFLRLSDMTVVPVAESEGDAELAAYARYGKGQGHPAQLNLGDCFAYACARVYDVPLLYVGNDFSQTDIRSALS